MYEEELRSKISCIVLHSSGFHLSTLFTFIKEISLRLEKIPQGPVKELGMGIALFKSNRGLCKAELIDLNSSRSELPNSNCFIFERSSSVGCCEKIKIGIVASINKIKLPFDMGFNKIEKF